MKYYSDLVCPTSKVKLEIMPTFLKCRICNKRYPIKDGIPIFISTEEYEKWDIHFINERTPLLLAPDRKRFTNKVTKNWETCYFAPLYENCFYTKYVDKWRIMLDLGCGEGIFSSPLSQKVEKIFCVDTSLLALKRLLRRQKENMYPVCADGRRLPFPDDFFDGVFLIFVIEHIENPLSILSEVRRVLKPQGHLVISTDSKFYYKYFRILLELIRYGRYRKNSATHVNLMTPKRVRNMLIEAKFISEHEDLSYFIANKFIRSVPNFISDPFQTSLIIHKCRPVK